VTRHIEPHMPNVRAIEPSTAAGGTSAQSQCRGVRSEPVTSHYLLRTNGCPPFEGMRASSSARRGHATAGFRAEMLGSIALTLCIWGSIWAGHRS